MAENEQIIPCPICGRIPRVKAEGINAIIPSTYPISVEVYCKPFLRKKHLSVTFQTFIGTICIGSRDSMSDYLRKKVIYNWNKKVKEVTNNDGE